MCENIPPGFIPFALCHSLPRAKCISHLFNHLRTLYGKHRGVTLAGPHHLVRHSPCAILPFPFSESELRMTARVLDGLKIRDEVFLELKDEIARLHAQGIRPGLAAVLVGENPASQL